MEPKPTVIFDFDGTLANTLELVARIYNEHAADFGALPVSLDELPVLRKLGYKNAMKEKRIRWTILPRMTLFISREMKQHMNEVSPYPGIVGMLGKMKEIGLTVGVLTSNNYELVQEFFRANNFPEFDFVVSERTLFGKEKALKRIMKKYKLATNKVVYVGDEPRDIVACRKATIGVIGVTWGVGGREGLADTPPDVLVDTADELYDSVVRMLQA